ncbi:bilirubin oxidase [Pyricularia oryzae Y34]|uniref:Bilirubin oxidase n=1 Tax=Pyricularia oryzae (strain Y34) TaxID=1143189 RepID=A0AA97NXF3_PYRO3|nr:bilirubin oxidase [Pyricularia oryzae Y34]
MYFPGKVVQFLQFCGIIAVEVVPIAEDWPGYVYNISAIEKAAKNFVIEDNPLDAIVTRGNWVSPEYKNLYSVALPIPPVLEPKRTLTNPTTGRPMHYYEVEIRPFMQQIYPDLGATRLVGYNGMSPGPTVIVPRDTETVMRFANNADQENAVHLHGSYSRAPWDGWAEDLTFPGQYKDYYYPNTQTARTLWYHDHAMHKTAENAYFGQAGFYMITDPAEDALNLPSGYGKFDIPLMLNSKQYNSNGTLYSPRNERDSLWGDVIHVNGQPWPFFDVQPRKYRLRFLNAAVSRNFALYFTKTNDLNARLDFQSIEIRNIPDVDNLGTDRNYEKTGQVMKINVAEASTLAEPDTSVVPSRLRAVNFPSGGNGIDHSFRFHRSRSEWLINGVGFSDVNNRVLANVPRGTVEIWELENVSGAWTHPIHMHLVDFRIISRQGGARNGVVEPYESKGLKDVVWLARNEKVLVEAHYAPWDGVYMFHCHNLIHEDNDMMAVFNVTSLPDFGYGDSARFVDPMQPEFRAKSYSADEMSARAGSFTPQAIDNQLRSLAEANPYPDPEGVKAALQQYWATKTAESTPAPTPISRVRRLRV